jgi:hypothetical protein
MAAETHVQDEAFLQFACLLGRRVPVGSMSDSEWTKFGEEVGFTETLAEFDWARDELDGAINQFVVGAIATQLLPQPYRLAVERVTKASSALLSKLTVASDLRVWRDSNRATQYCASFGRRFRSWKPRLAVRD